MVLWCLYDDQVEARASRLDGHSMKTSKQSITTATLSPKEVRKHSGIVFLRFSLSGHITSGCNRTSIAVSHLSKILEIVEGCTLKQ